MPSIAEFGSSLIVPGGMSLSESFPVWSWTIALAVLLLAATWSSSGAGEDAFSVREPILAGSWYEGDPGRLESAIERYLRGEGRPPVDVPDGAAGARERVAAGLHPSALIVPHAGHVYSGACAGATLSLLEGSGYRRVILIGPSHRVPFNGAALSGADAFATPLGRIPLDMDAIRKLAGMQGLEVFGQAHESEHSLEIMLPFLQRVLQPGFTLIPIVIGQIDGTMARRIAAALTPLWDESTVMVISSDFTHYGANFRYVPFRDNVPEEIASLDEGAIRQILDLDGEGFTSYRESTRATICGAAPIRILLEMIGGGEFDTHLIDYYRSGDMTGDFSTSVSYAGIAFFPARDTSPSQGDGGSSDRRKEGAGPGEPARPGSGGLGPDGQEYLLSLARKTLEAVVHGATIPRPVIPDRFGPDSPLHEERGVFVTLSTLPGGRLRGCIGSIVGDQPLAEGVVRNAVAAATRDPRFPPVGPAEYGSLHIEISVLTPLQPVESYEEIVIGRDGIIMEKGGRRSVFLPKVAPEQGWDLATTLTQLSLKAGLGPDDWRSGATFRIFQAQVFEEPHH